MRSLSTAKMRSSNLADTMYCHRLSHTQALEQKQSFDPDRNIAFRHVWGWSVPPGKYLCIYDLDGIYSRLGRKSKKEPIWAHLHGSPFKKEGIGVHVFREYTQRSVKTVTYDWVIEQYLSNCISEFSCESQFILIYLITRESKQSRV